MTYILKFQQSLAHVKKNQIPTLANPSKRVKLQRQREKHVNQMNENKPKAELKRSRRQWYATIEDLK